MTPPSNPLNTPPHHIAFEYDAFHLVEHQNTHGLLYADNEREARLLLREQSLIPTKIKQISQKEDLTSFTRLFQTFMNPIQQLFGLNTLEKAQWEWVHTMSILKKEGLSFPAALEKTIEHTTHPKWHVQLTHLKQSLLQGNSLQNTLSEDPSFIAQPIHALLIEADKQNGLMDCFEPLCEWKKANKKNTFNIYPVLYLSLIFYITTFYTCQHIQYTQPTAPQLLQISASLFLGLHQLFSVIAPALIFLLILWPVIQPKRPNFLWDQFKQTSLNKIPVLKEHHTLTNYHTLFLNILTGLKSNLRLIESIQFTNNHLSNPFFNQHITPFLHRIQGGHSLEESLLSLPDLPFHIKQECQLRQNIPSQEWIQFFEHHGHQLRETQKKQEKCLQIGLWVWASLLLLAVTFSLL